MLRHAVPADSSSSPPPPRNPRVLVVDDSAAIRRTVAAMFEEADYSVVAAASGEEGFERALAEPFDVVVTDVTMPDLSGLQLCRILRSDDATRAMPIVMLTAADSPHDRFCARHAGADAYVTKAEARHRLVETVEGLVDRSSLRAPPSEPRGRPHTDPVRRLSRVLEQHLFQTLVSSEIRGLSRHVQSRRELGEAVVKLCAEILEHAYVVLELRGPEGRSLTIHARGPWTAGRQEGLAMLGIETSDEDVIDVFHLGATTSTAVTSGPAHACAIEAGGDVLGSLTVFGSSEAIDERTRALADHIANELTFVARSLVLIERMRRMAHTDSLTGLANRRRGGERLQHELARCARTGRPVCFVLCDIDHFKAVNDTHGHNYGDEVLQAVASEMTRRVRSVDLVVRWGGEEFAVILPEASREGGRLVAERLRRAIEIMELDGPADQVTISAGVVLCDPDLPVDEVVRRADECLYEAKANGRNRVVTWAKG